GAPHDRAVKISAVVVESVIGAEGKGGAHTLIGAGNRNHARADDIFGNLNADAAEVSACAHDQHGFAALEESDVDEQVPGRRYMADHHSRGMKIELRRNLDVGTG